MGAGDRKDENLRPLYLPANPLAFLRHEEKLCALNHHLCLLESLRSELLLLSEKIAIKAPDPKVLHCVI